MIYCLLILVKSILTLILKIVILLLTIITLFYFTIDQHAPLKTDYVVPHDVQPRITGENIVCSDVHCIMFDLNKYHAWCKTDFGLGWG